MVRRTLEGMGRSPYTYEDVCKLYVIGAVAAMLGLILSF